MDDTFAFEVDYDASLHEFDNAMSVFNNDFKENVIRQAQTMKTRDQQQLDQAVEEIKVQESNELGKLNKTYLELDTRFKKLERKNDRISEIVDSWIE